MLNTFISGGQGVAAIHTSIGVHTPGQMATLSYPNEQLSIGDEVTIRIVATDKPDPPTKRTTESGTVEIVSDQD